ncbi:hypothetical protein [Rhodoblastus sp.]|uniref:hypothetical protein n=1 Tax=Rhodoblastus sp. TaxID=1962975 RepID=UPI003F9C2443
MADPHVISALRDKQRAIQGAIISYERALDEARRDLANVNAVLAMYGRETDPEGWQAHMSVAKVFARGEVFAICKKALDDAPDGLDTRQLAVILLQAKGLDENDRIMRRNVAYNIVQIMGNRLKRGSITSKGKRNGVRVWSCPTI